MYVSMYVHFCKVKKEVLEVKLQVAKGINTKVQQRITMFTIVKQRIELSFRDHSLNPLFH